MNKDNFLIQYYLIPEGDVTSDASDALHRTESDSITGLHLLSNALPIKGKL